MRKRFKLVKKYPGSAPVGTIYEQTIDGGASYELVNGGRSTLVLQVEENPEYFHQLYKVADGEITADETVYFIFPTIKKIGEYTLNNYISKIDLDKAFVSKENAEAKLKEIISNRDLQYYIKKVKRNIGHTSTGIIFNTSPKSFYQLVLQAVADDLNGDWKPIWDSSYIRRNYVITYDHLFKNYSVESWSIINTGGVYFKDENTAKEAITIMGDTLNTVFDI